MRCLSYYRAPRPKSRPGSTPHRRAQLSKNLPKPYLFLAARQSAPMGRPPHLSERPRAAKARFAATAKFPRAAAFPVQSLLKAA